MHDTLSLSVLDTHGTHTHTHTYSTLFTVTRAQHIYANRSRIVPAANRTSLIGANVPGKYRCAPHRFRRSEPAAPDACVRLACAMLLALKFRSNRSERVLI